MKSIIKKVKSISNSGIMFAMAIVVIAAFTMSFAPEEGKLVSKTGHISFFSHTEVEDITANNFKVVSTIDPSSGNIVFSVAMQSFEFEKSMMQKHFNSSKFLDTKTFPKSKFKGTITNLDEIKFGEDGTYTANVEGTLEMHGVTNNISETGSITVNGKTVTVDLKMNVTLNDYKIAFEKGKPSTNIAKSVEITLKSDHLPE